MLLCCDGVCYCNEADVRVLVDVIPLPAHLKKVASSSVAADSQGHHSGSSACGSPASRKPLNRRSSQGSLGRL